MCGVSGYAYDFECYMGKSDNILLPGEQDCGASGNVVIRLTRHLPPHVNHKVYFDNYFTSPDLQIFLAKKGIWSVGTVRQNRVPHCTLKSDAALKKLGRGSLDEKVSIVDGLEIAAVRWFDNRAVTLISTFAGCEPVTEVTRWNSKTHSHEMVTCPSIVTVYNKHMGGVDLMDSLIGLYRIKIRSKKWYHRLFFHFVDMAIVNSWLLYRRNVNTDERHILKLHEFKSHVAGVLCRAEEKPTSRRGRPRASANDEDDGQGSTLSLSSKKTVTCNPLDEIRYDGSGHLPKMTDQRCRCRLEGCHSQSRVMCIKCNVHLCVLKGDCFIKYHSSSM